MDELLALQSDKSDLNTKLKYRVNHVTHSKRCSDNEMPGTSMTVDQALINSSILKIWENTGVTFVL